MNYPVSPFAHQTAPQKCGAAAWVKAPPRTWNTVIELRDSCAPIAVMKIRFPFRCRLALRAVDLPVFDARAADAATSPALRTSFDENGLATLRYGDLNFDSIRAANCGDNAFSALRCRWRAHRERSGTRNSQTLTFRYTAGASVACQYTQRGDQLDLDIGDGQSLDAREVGGFNLFPLGRCALPGFPKGYDAYHAARPLQRRRAERAER